MDILAEQYAGVKGARQALFNYLAGVALPDIFKPLETYNNTSIAGLLLHVANVYTNWLNNFERADSVALHELSEIKMLDDLRAMYKQVDASVESFLARHRDDLASSITRELPNGKTATANPLQLFTHVITHEFHHKGQILNMSRQLGYVPVDTDFIRF